jgi:hypothetical protein
MLPFIYILKNITRFGFLLMISIISNFSICIVWFIVSWLKDSIIEDSFGFIDDFCILLPFLLLLTLDSNWGIIGYFQ